MRMSEALVRLDNLKAIMKSRAWDKSELARRLGRTPQQIGAWFNGQRNIGERLARDIETKLGLWPYVLDGRTDQSSGGATALPAAEGAGTYAPAVTKVSKRTPRELPVIEWADLVVMLDQSNETVGNSRPVLETYAVSSVKAKFVKMPDDSMAPEIVAGDHLLFDPMEAPRAGDVVLVRLPGNELYVRTFKPRTAMIWDAVAANTDYLTLSSKNDQAEVAAVLVEHRRYRR